MPDLITYSTDVSALATELTQKRPKRVMVSQSGVTFLVPKVPSKRKGLRSLSMVRAGDDEVSLLQGLDNLQVLGTREEVFADPAKLAIYREFYPEGSKTVSLPWGGEIEVPNPEMPTFF